MLHPSVFSSALRKLVSFWPAHPQSTLIIITSDATLDRQREIGDGLSSLDFQACRTNFINWLGQRAIMLAQNIDG